MDPVLILLIVLLVLWIGGVGIGYTAGGLIHVLIVAFLVIAIVRLCQGQKIL